MLKKFTLLLLTLIIGKLMFCQHFNVIKTIELETLYGEQFYAYYDRIQSENKTIIPIYPIYEDDFENMIYVVIDSLDNFSLLQWKREADKDGYKDTPIAGIFLDNNKGILISEYLYYFQIKGKQMLTTKKIKPPNQSKYGEFYEIYPLGDNSSKYVLLANTYNCSSRKTIYDIFRFAKFNIKKKKIEKIINIDVGKGIFLSHFSNHMISTSKNNIAISHPCKPEVYLFDNDLNLLDTIVIDYPNIFKTKNLLDSILTDTLILENRYMTINLLQILHNNNIMKYPRIDKVAFIDEDLLFIFVKPDAVVDTNNNWHRNHLHYVYSLSNKDFFETKGKISNFDAINSSQPLIFHNNKTVAVWDSVDTNNLFKYYISFCEISIDFNSKYIDTIDLSILPPFLHLKSIDSLNKNQNYEKFNYIMVANYAACSHCKFYDKYPNLMIIHVFDKNDAYNRSTMLSYKTKYNKMFDNPTVYFCEDSMIDLNKIKINAIYKTK